MDKYKKQYDSSDLEITIDDEYDDEYDDEDDIECDDDYEDDIECDDNDDDIKIPNDIHTINAIKNLLGM